MQNKTFEGIKENKLFTWIDPDFISRLKFDHKKFFVYKAGCIIYRINDESDLLYLVVEGEVKIKNYHYEKSGSAGSVIIKIKNDFFGEKEIIYRTPRASVAIANSDCTLYGLSINDLPKYLIRKLYYLNNAAFPEQEYLPKETKTFLEYPEEDKTKGKNHFSRVKAPGKMNYYRELQTPPFQDTFINEEKFTAFENKIDFFQDLKSENAVRHEYEKPGELTGSMIKEEYNQENDVLELKKVSESKFSPSKTPQEELQPEIKRLAAAINNVSFSDKKINSVLIELANLMDCEKCELFIADTANNELKRWSHLRSREVKFKIGLGVTGIAAERKEIILSKDVKYDQRFIREYEGAEGTDIKSMLCFPLINRENNLAAVLQFINSVKGEFTECEKKYLELFSSFFLSFIESEINRDTAEANKFFTLRKTAANIKENLSGTIQSIKSYSDLLCKLNLSPEANKIAETIRTQAECTEEYILTLAEYADGNISCHVEKTDIADVLNNSLKSLAEFADTKNIKLFKKFNANASVFVDKKKFHQACFYVINNFCQAMPFGGKIYVKTGIEEGMIRIEFKDSGTGIPGDIKEKMFNPFITSDEYNRVEIGLAITEEIITKLGGFIEALNNPGEGASVTISLPVCVELIN